MKRALLLVAALLASTGSAQAEETQWEILGHVGAGRFFGKGADTNRFGGSVAISGGPRLHPLVSIRALFQLEYLRLRKVGDLDDGNGESYVLASGPHFHPLGRAYRIQPYIGALAGIAYTRASTTSGSATVETRSRAVVIGGTVGAVWQFDEHWSAGLALVALPLFVDKSCVRIIGDATSCEAETEGLNVLGSLSALVKWTF